MPPKGEWSFRSLHGLPSNLEGVPDEKFGSGLERGRNLFQKPLHPILFI